MRTWPVDWEERKRGEGCPMCAEGRPERDGLGNRRVWAGQYVDAYLQPTAAPLGYTVVV